MNTNSINLFFTLEAQCDCGYVFSDGAFKIHFLDEMSIHFKCPICEGSDCMLDLELS